MADAHPGPTGLGELVARRRMVRRYHPDPVAPEVVRRILHVAARAPSAGFSQPFRWVVVTGARTRTAIAEVCGEPAAVARGLEPWLSVAPVHVLPCVERGAYVRRYAEADKTASVGPDGWEVPFEWVDGGAALMSLLLAVVEEGLAAGFLAVQETAVRGVVTFPDEWRPIGLVTIGHGRDDGRPGSQRRARQPLEEQVRWVED